MMILDNETGNFPPSPRKSYNPFDSDDDTLDSIKEHLNAVDEGAGDQSWEEAVFGQATANSSANGRHTSSFERDGQLYTDKNVTECDQSVKDIGIDEGVPVHGKIWVQSCEHEIKVSSSLLDKGDAAVESPKSMVKEEQAVSGQNLAPESGYKDFLKINEVKLGSEEPDLNKEDSRQAEPHFMSEDGPDQELATEEISSHLSVECSEAAAESDKNPIEDSNLPISSKAVAVPESANTSAKAESESAEAAKPQATQSMTRQEESPRNLHGETSFSSIVAGPLPPSITFTGPVAYSGNISYRSESSAGSTRSFAFPVLQTEWSSPERMVRADQRQRRLNKQKGWVQALICCRF